MLQAARMPVVRVPRPGIVRTPKSFVRKGIWSWRLGVVGDREKGAVCLLSSERPRVEMSANIVAVVPPLGPACLEICQ